MTTVDFSVDEYPYNHDGQSLKSVVESYKLDDSEKQDVSDDRRLVLFGTDGWETVTLEISVTVEDETLEYVFPNPEQHEGVIVVAGYCPSTHKRFAEPVIWHTGHTDSFGGGTYTTEVTLERSDFRERVSLTPKLVRNRTRSGEDDYASKAGRELATGRGWDVFFDEPVLSLEGDLPVEAARFSERTDLGTENNEWYVDVRNAEEPKLWVNKDHPYVVEVLNAVDDWDKRGHVGRVVLNHLAASMLTQFTIKAVQHAVVTGEIEYQWQKTLLTDVCSEYFGTNPTVDELEDLLQPEAISTTINQVESIVQRRRTPHEDVQKLLGVIGDE